MKICYDIDMIRQSTPLSFSAEVSLQIPSENLQPYQEFFEDLDSIDTVPDHVVDLVKFEHQEIGHVYYDPIGCLHGRAIVFRISIDSQSFWNCSQSQNFVL
jgi:hypothetical protein